MLATEVSRVFEGAAVIPFDCPLTKNSYQVADAFEVPVNITSSP